MLAQLDTLDSYFTILVVVLFVGVICAAVGGLITSSKGQGAATGIVLGFLLGVIGLIIALVMRPAPRGDRPGTRVALRTRECPHCRELMRRDASVCPHCQRDSTAWLLIDGAFWATRDSDGNMIWWDDRGGTEWRRLRTAPTCPFCSAPMEPAEHTCPSCHRVSSREYRPSAAP